MVANGFWGEGRGGSFFNLSTSTFSKASIFFPLYVNFSNIFFVFHCWSLSFNCFSPETYFAVNLQFNGDTGGRYPFIIVSLNNIDWLQSQFYSTYENCKYCVHLQNRSYCMSILIPLLKFLRNLKALFQGRYVQGWE